MSNDEQLVRAAIARVDRKGSDYKRRLWQQRLYYAVEFWFLVKMRSWWYYPVCLYRDPPRTALMLCALDLEPDKYARNALFHSCLRFMDEETPKQAH